MVKFELMLVPERKLWCTFNLDFFGVTMIISMYLGGMIFVFLWYVIENLCEKYRVSLGFSYCFI